MGSCLCKDQDSQTEERTRNGSAIHSDPAYGAGGDCLEHYTSEEPSVFASRFPASSTVDRLVLETLSVIGSMVENEQEPPPAMLKLHSIADHEDGWIQVVSSMIRVIPMRDPLGPAVITLLLDDCPLPTKESVVHLSELLSLSAAVSTKGRASPTEQRNVCVVLGCLAEKLAGPSSIAILTSGTLDYLVANLSESVDPSVILFSLIALEKFAQTSENKVTIKKRLDKETKNPLNFLETWVNSEHFVKRQVGFCAQWCLDNLFIVDERAFSYKCVDTTGINVMLNTKDVSEYLKISPDGLEARCDAYSFESVRCTFQVDEGAWYYETQVITPGVMQIGWATKDSTFLNHEGYGIGDDPFSVAYDGCRRLVWHDARNHSQGQPAWQPGDILGCLLDLAVPEAIFYLNGEPLPPCTDVFGIARSGFFAAASFMSFQQCRFNFGATPFKFSPKDRSFQSFNMHATLDPADKVVLPRHVRLEELRKLSVREDSCSLCFDQRASIRLEPCGHRGFCSTCCAQLSECPMCRALITSTVSDSPS